MKVQATVSVTVGSVPELVVKSSKVSRSATVSVPESAQETVSLVTSFIGGELVFKSSEVL
jgi:hypothetical protein